MIFEYISVQSGITLKFGNFFMHSGIVKAIFSLEGNLLRAQSSAWSRQIQVVKIEENLDVEIQKRPAIPVVNSPTFKRIKTANNWSMRGRVLLLGLCLPTPDAPSPFQYIIPLAFGSRKLQKKKLNQYTLMNFFCPTYTSKTY